MTSKLTARQHHSAPSRGLAVTVSGSFHRHLQAIKAAVEELAAMSIRVLSPADPRIVAEQGEFLFVASDRVRSVKLVQDRHLESIRAASFLWLVCPDGYVGQSASLEVGYAIAAGVPIFATHAPDDLTLRQYVTVVDVLRQAVRIAAANDRPRCPEGLLIDPHASIAEVHEALERVDRMLTCQNEHRGGANCVGHEVADIYEKLTLPSLLQ